jgi:D-arabinose 1-dehydrogenase-like Zn-dependent alcohol dehydrogenase
MQIIEWGKPLEAREYPDPEPKGEEVLLRAEAAGVCHSDVLSGTGTSIWAASDRSR